MLARHGSAIQIWAFFSSPMSMYKEFNSTCIILVASFDPKQFSSREWCTRVDLFLDPKQTVGALATAIQLSLSLHILYLKTGLRVSNPNILAISFINWVKGITSCIAADSAIYSLSVVLIAILICILLPYVMGHPAYIITQPVLYKTDAGAS